MNLTTHPNLASPAYLVGNIGLMFGEPCSCLTEEGENILEQYPFLRELADLMALEACVNDDVRGYVAIYPYRRWVKREEEAVSLFWH